MGINANTHDIFFKFLTRKKLKELLLRAVETDGKKVLEDDINHRLQGKTNVIAQTRISPINNKNSTHTTKRYYPCSLYINFMDDNIQIGHITFHFSPTNPGHSSYAGRIHPVNNNENRRNMRNFTFKFNKLVNSVRMSLAPTSIQMNSKLEPCINTAIEVLNEYFNPKNTEMFLGKKFFPDGKSECYNYIVSIMSYSRTPLRNTRKRQYH
jgi:hypothetical protein